MSYSYYPKRPIKSFQDLEVYQKLLAVCVAVVKRSAAEVQNTSDGVRRHSSEVKELASETTSVQEHASTTTEAISGAERSEVKEIVGKLHQTVLSLPILIAAAHSVRFSNQSEAIAKLEEAMLNCNLAVVYLEQYRDLARHEIEPEFFEEQIKTLLSTRGRVMRLQMSWKKFMEEKK